jgi:hypothetical protein
MNTAIRDPRGLPRVAHSRQQALLQACGSDAACCRLVLPPPKKPCDCFAYKGCAAPHLPITCQYRPLGGLNGFARVARLLPGGGP